MCGTPVSPCRMNGERSLRCVTCHRPPGTTTMRLASRELDRDQEQTRMKGKKKDQEGEDEEFPGVSCPRVLLSASGLCDRAVLRQPCVGGGQAGLQSHILTVSTTCPTALQTPVTCHTREDGSVNGRITHQPQYCQTVKPVLQVRHCETWPSLHRLLRLECI